MKTGAGRPPEPAAAEVTPIEERPGDRADEEMETDPLARADAMRGQVVPQAENDERRRVRIMREMWDVARRGAELEEITSEGPFPDERLDSDIAVLPGNEGT